MATPLAGKVALVAGATRGAGRGIAVQLGAAGATVYVTGRTTRSERSEMNRPETIEETAALVNEAGGRGIAAPRARRSLAGPSRRSHRIPMCHGGTESPCPAGSWRRYTASPISTAANPMPGATSSKFRTQANPPTQAATGNVVSPITVRRPAVGELQQ